MSFLSKINEIKAELTVKKLSNASGSAAWALAEKHGTNDYPVYFKYLNKLIAHFGTRYNEGKLHDYGFSNDAAKAANSGGLWQEVETED